MKAKSMTYEAKSTDLRPPRRRRTEKAAIEHLDKEVRLPRNERRSALERIRRARQPLRETKRIISNVQQRAVSGVLRTSDDLIDFSDVQELRVKLIRRDGGVWEPQALMLRRMEVDIATKGMTGEEFRERAGVVWGLRQVLPPSARNTQLS